MDSHEVNFKTTQHQGIDIKKERGENIIVWIIGHTQDTEKRK